MENKEREIIAAVDTFYKRTIAALSKYDELNKEQKEAEKKKLYDLYRSIKQQIDANVMFRENLVEKFVAKLKELYKD